MPGRSREEEELSIYNNMVAEEYLAMRSSTMSSPSPRPWIAYRVTHDEDGNVLSREGWEWTIKREAEGCEEEWLEPWNAPPPVIDSSGYMSDGTANHIAHCVNQHDALVAEVAELRGALEAMSYFYVGTNEIPGHLHGEEIEIHKNARAVLAKGGESND